ncbi:TIGR00366 family protein [Sporosarcina sp. YIM B06819]|uniref:TIGR00366 family protein n=1 Tax=Sporosarcina sp. YIM B06819 TaxID=3081769 RepID=UPI00298CC64E|nr:TIGR00366 family protein [Sporosarcina sp. YIM B06819]
MLWKISKRFQFAADRYIPETLVFSLILTVVVMGMGLFIASPIEVVTSWYGGLWNMIAFAFQMSIMVIACGAAAKAPQVDKLLVKVAKLTQSRVVAVVVLMLVAVSASIVNWAFALILTAILSKKLSVHVKGLHFPLLIALGYSAMLLGQSWSPTASVYALLATPGHFLEDQIGILTQFETTYNPINTVIFFIILIVTLLISIFIKPPLEEVVSYDETKDNDIALKEMQAKADAVIVKEDRTPADRMNSGRFLMYFFGAVGIVVIINSFITKGVIGSLDLNFAIFLFIVLCLFLYNTPESFMGAFKSSITSATEIMVMFIFYGGIMGIMAGTGLTKVMADSLLAVATTGTLPLFTYWSASFINLFVPSQGGQWIIQGPVLIEAAQALKVDIGLIANAFVYGDEATNLLQPLYAIPALAIVGMKLKDVWGLMAFIWAIWFVVTSLAFVVLPPLFGY